jgi:site-specific recombinase XerD
MIDYTEAPGEWGVLAKSWRKALMSDNKSRNTIRIYLHAVRQLGLWAYRQPKPPEPTTITTAEVRDYMADVLARTSAANAHNHYRSLRTFFVFLMEEDEIDRSPMDRVKAPMVPDKPIPLVTLETMSALLDTCKGKTFVDRRDTAILRVLWDTGGRRAEISNLPLTALDLDTDGIQVVGKGRRTRYIPIGIKTSLALTRYLRVRSLHPQAALPALWLGSTGQGALTHPGIKAMLNRRCREAGVGHIHPHMFRHSLAHYWQSEQGNEGDLMRIMGWKSREMLARYGASAADERAHATARALRLGDRV